MKIKILLIPLLLSLISTPLFAQAPETAHNKLNISISDQFMTISSSENYEYDFGSIPVGTPSAAYFTITNNSTHNLTFQSGTIAGDYFSGEHSCAAGLKPKAQCDVAIYYDPETTGDHVGALDISFLPNLNIHVDLFGNAY